MSRRRWAAYILPILAVAAISAAYSTGDSNHLCKQQYALCTSAPCIPVPGEPGKAICMCDVEEGPSLSTVPCEMLQPTKDSNGIVTVYSTFSLKQPEEGKLGMKCPAGTPWTWCLNKKCTIDPKNPQKAICTCDVKRTDEEWTTFGGNCDTSTCKTGYWSGATIKDAESGAQFLVKALGLKASPVKWCQGNAK